MKPYKDYSDFLAEHFEVKMQKLTIDAGFSCPNRDGTIGRGGCTYCNNASFSPGHAYRHEDVAAQIERSRQFFARKYPSMRYLAYFQSYTSTHGDPDRLLDMFREALAVEGVDGLVIGTRPDCIGAPLLRSLKEIGRFVMIEYGAESSHDATLQRVNRCHTWADTVSAVNLTASMGIPVGLHFIMGLPGESVEDMLTTVERINALPVDVVKFHQMQVISHTELCRQYMRGEADIVEWSVDEYIELCCRIVKMLRPDIAIDRFVSQAPDGMLVWPKWGLKNYEFIAKLRAAIERRDYL